TCPDLPSLARENAIMSLSECERFAADLQSNAALRTEAQGTPLASLVALAVSRGYSITLEEARQHLRARPSAPGRVLSDAELDGIAAGADKDPDYWIPLVRP